MAEPQRPTSDARNDEARIAVLLKSLERESLAFECRVMDTPFVPSDRKVGFETFRQHCKHVDSLLDPDSDSISIRHVCYMAARETLTTWTAIQYFLLGDHQTVESRSVKVNAVRQSAFDVFLSPLFSTNLIPDMRRHGLAGPQMVDASGVLLLCYLVSGSGAKKYAHVYSFQDTDLTQADVLCDALAIDWKSNENRKETLSLIRNTVTEMRPIFESYHILWCASPCTFLPCATDNQLLCSLSMQFQREWADQDKKYRDRQNLLLTLSHEFNNSLYKTGWNELLTVLYKWQPAESKDQELRGAIIGCLSQLVWPQGFASALRAFTKAILDTDRLETDFLDKSLGSASQYLEDYQASVDRLVRFELGRFPDLIKRQVKLIRLARADESPEQGRVASDILDNPESFDAKKLRFPPLKQGDDDAATFFAASFLIEPIRNALKYMSDNKVASPLFAWGVSSRPGSDDVDVAFVNRVQIANDKLLDVLDKIRTTRLLNEAGFATRFATIEPPEFIPGTDFLRLTVRLHPDQMRGKVSDDTTA